MTTRTRLDSLAAITAIVAILAGCEIIDDQTVIREAELEYANPPVAAADHAAANARHQVLVGVIDTGVDYLHPRLAAHMHYDLGADGQPTGLGHDYIGNDRWPSPYVVRTDYYNEKIEDQKDKEKSLKRFQATEKLLAAAPELRAFLSEFRAIEQEVDAGAYHGTHVAGLMVYDVPEIGLVPYRLLPHNRDPKDKYLGDYDKIFIANLKAAIQKAAADGVRVINMSLGMAVEKPQNGDSDATFKQRMAWLLEIRALVEANPQILFVVAAGNDGAWSDGRTRAVVPCNVNTANSICVGALGEDFEPTSFTNIDLSRADMLLALGEKVLSTMPMKICNDGAVQYLYSDDTISDEDMPQKIERIKRQCTDKTMGMGRLSGTSMASPLVAHVAAEAALANPKASGAELARAVFAQAERSQIGVLPVMKLRIRKPSWYSDGGLAQPVETPEALPEQAGFFEMVMPVTQ